MTMKYICTFMLGYNLSFVPNVIVIKKNYIRSHYTNWEKETVNCEK